MGNACTTRSRPRATVPVQSGASFSDSGKTHDTSQKQKFFPTATIPGSHTGLSTESQHNTISSSDATPAAAGPIHSNDSGPDANPSSTAAVSNSADTPSPQEPKPKEKTRHYYIFDKLPIEDFKHPLKDHHLLIIGHKVYDVTDFAEYHPGGLRAMIAHKDSDCSMAFQIFHSGNKKSSTATFMPTLYVGDMASCPESHRRCPQPYFPPQEDEETAADAASTTADASSQQQQATKYKDNEKIVLRPSCPRMASKSDLIPNLRLDEVNMFARLGFARIRSISEQFYKHVFEDEDAVFFRELFTIPRDEVIYNSYTFFVERFGGPSLDARASYMCTNDGMVNSHAHMPFDKKYQDYWLMNISRSMKEVGVEEENHEILMEYFNATMKELDKGLKEFNQMVVS